MIDINNGIFLLLFFFANCEGLYINYFCNGVIYDIEMFVVDSSLYPIFDLAPDLWQQLELASRL